MDKYEMKSMSAQTQMIASMLLLLLASTTILAYNATVNLTGSITGNILAGERKYIEEFKEIGIFAATRIEYTRYQNILFVRLVMDNGTVVKGKRIEFYVNSNPCAEKITGNDYISFEVPPDAKVIDIAFRGDNESFLMPSKERVEIRKEEMIIQEFYANATRVNVNEYVKLSVRLNENYTTNISNVTFVILDSGGNIIDLKTEQMNNTFYALLKLEKPGKYFWKAIYVYNNNGTVISFAHPDLVIEGILLKGKVSIVNIFTKKLTSNTFKISAILTSKDGVTKGVIAKLLAPEEVVAVSYTHLTLPTKA